MKAILLAMLTLQVSAMSEIHGQEKPENGISSGGRTTKTTAMSPTNVTETIARLNKLIGGAQPGQRTNIDSSLTNAPDEKVVVSRLKESLALQGISIRSRNGQYIDSSSDVARGYSLDPEERKTLALLNYTEQNYGVLQAKKSANYLIPGEVRARIRTMKRQLEEKGVSVLWDQDLYIVTSKHDKARAKAHR